MERYDEEYYTEPEVGQFTREPNRPEHLDLSRFTSGENKPTPLVYESGGEYEDIELTDEEIAQYRAGGYVVEEMQGGGGTGGGHDFRSILGYSNLPQDSMANFVKGKEFWEKNYYGDITTPYENLTEDDMYAIMDNKGGRKGYAEGIKYNKETGETQGMLSFPVYEKPYEEPARRKGKDIEKIQPKGLSSESDKRTIHTNIKKGVPKLRMPDIIGYGYDDEGNVVPQYQRSAKPSATRYNNPYHKGDGGELPSYQGDVDGSEVKDPIAGIYGLPSYDVVVDKETGRDYPFYNELSEEEKGLFRNPSVIGSSIRDKAAYYGKGQPTFSDDLDYIGNTVFETAAEFTPIPAAFRIADDPMAYLKATGEAISDLAPYAQTLFTGSPAPGVFNDTNSFTGRPKWENIDKALDVATVVPELGAAVKALKLGKYAKQGLKSNFAKEVIDELENIYHPIKHRKTIKEIEGLNKNLKKSYDTPEMKRRLNNMGLSQEALFPPTLTWKSGIGSHFSAGLNNINMDLSELKRLKKQDHMLPANTVYAHEVGHWLQKEGVMASPTYKTQLLKYKYEKAIWDEKLKNIKWYDSKPPPIFPAPPTSAKTKFDNLLTSKPLTNLPGADPTKEFRNFGTIYDPKKQKFTTDPKLTKTYKDWDYFREGSEGHEPLAFARELRQNMINKGYIKNVESKISDENLMKFIEENPKDRISSFIAKQPAEVRRLKQVLNNIPAVVPIGLGAAGAAGLTQEEDGGEIMDLTNEEIADMRAQGYVVEEDIEMQSGGTVSELWKQHTGTPWSEAHKQQLTSGSYADNMALRKKILSGEFDQISQAAPTTYQDISFSDAFASARREQGPGGRFVWNGQTYGTNYKTESNVKKQEPETAVEPIPEPIQEPMVRSPYMQPPSPFMLPGEEVPIIKDSIPTSDIAPIRPTTP